MLVMMMPIKKALLALGKPWETGVTILPVLHLSAYQAVISILISILFDFSPLCVFKCVLGLFAYSHCMLRCDDGIKIIFSRSLAL